MLDSNWFAIEPLFNRNLAVNFSLMLYVYQLRLSRCLIVILLLNFMFTLYVQTVDVDIYDLYNRILIGLGLSCCLIGILLLILCLCCMFCS